MDRTFFATITAVALALCCFGFGVYLVSVAFGSTNGERRYWKLALASSLARAFIDSLGDIAANVG